MLTKTTLKKGLWITLGIVLIAVIAILYKVNSSLERLDLDTTNIIIHEDSEIKISASDLPEHEQADQEVVEQKPEDFYMLLIGLDYRENFFSLNTDSIIVSHVIPQNQIVKLVSLPRDLRMANLRKQDVKVNAIFAEGYQHALVEGRKNPELLSGKRARIGSLNVPEEYISSGSYVLREAIEHYLDIDIEYTFLVNFQTVTSLVDEVGGIEIMVDRSMEYDDPTDNTHIHLQKGLQVLNGEDALNFARFREDNRGVEYFSNDFERGIRQQQVIMALANELSSWSNISKIFNLLDIISANFKTDMGKRQMTSLIRTFHGSLKSDSIITIPFNGYWKSPFVEIDQKELDELVAQFTSIEAPSGSIQVSVSNE